MMFCEIKMSCVLVLLENWSDVTRSVNVRLGVGGIYIYTGFKHFSLIFESARPVYYICR